MRHTSPYLTPTKTPTGGKHHTKKSTARLQMLDLERRARRETTASTFTDRRECMYSRHTLESKRKGRALFLPLFLDGTQTSVITMECTKREETRNAVVLGVIVANASPPSIFQTPPPKSTTKHEARLPLLKLKRRDSQWKFRKDLLFESPVTSLSATTRLLAERVDDISDSLKMPWFDAATVNN
jgi:hypothetical protein